MISIDMNVLVRYLAQDDPKQSAIAIRLIESLTATAPGFIVRSLTVTPWANYGNATCLAEDREMVEVIVFAKRVTEEQFRPPAV